MSIDWITVAAQIVNFLVLVWLLKRFLYRPILNGIDALSPAMQLSLLRVVTEGSFQPIGGHETLTSNVRFLIGAHRDLRLLISHRQFRSDLFFAIAVTELAIPPLRARVEDIPLLAERMLHDVAEEHGKPVRGLSRPALEFLEAYDWPGNLPELRNEVTRMLGMSELVKSNVSNSNPSNRTSPPLVPSQR